MPERFPVARDILSKLDLWFASLAAPSLPARRVPDGKGSVHWEFVVHSAETVQLAKAARMVSGIRAAMFLVDHGFVTEGGTVLRTVSDFHAEIVALGEGLLAGRLTADQQKFVDQFFAPFPSSPEEHERSERERYVSREDLLKAHRKLAEQGTIDPDELLRIRRFLNKGYDGYVHGAYLTAMELYRGDAHAFMLSGTDFERHRCIAQAAVVGKLHEVVFALSVMATSRGMQPLFDEMHTELKRLDASDEQAGAECSRIASDLQMPRANAV
jgi:hypothetical protein